MKRVTHLIAVLLVGLYNVSVQAAGHVLTEINVGYLQQRPTPAQFSQATQTYDSVIGIPVNWRPFADGNSMNAALAAGEVDIVYAHGMVPFTVGVTDGLEMTAVGIAVDYPENDLCIVGSSTGITRANAAGLEGRRVATVVGGVTHYKMLKVLEHLQVDTAGIEIVPIATDAEAA